MSNTKSTVSLETKFLKNPISREWVEMTISSLLDLSDENKIEYSPTLPGRKRSFQRGKCWSLKFKRDLILSLFENLPVGMGMIYTDPNDKNEKIQLVDSKQRISTIIDFINGKFKILASDLQKILILGVLGKDPKVQYLYAELPRELQEIFKSRILYFDELKNANAESIINGYLSINKQNYSHTASEKKMATTDLDTVYECKEKLGFQEELPEDDSYFLPRNQIGKCGIKRMKDNDIVTELLYTAVKNEASDIISEVGGSYNKTRPVERNKLMVENTDNMLLVLEKLSPEMKTKAISKVYDICIDRLEYIMGNDIKNTIFHFKWDFINLFRCFANMADDKILTKTVIKEKRNELKKAILKYSKDVRVARKERKLGTLSKSKMSPIVIAYAQTDQSFNSDPDIVSGYLQKVIREAIR